MQNVCVCVCVLCKREGCVSNIYTRTGDSFQNPDSFSISMNGISVADCTPQRVGVTGVALVTVRARRASSIAASPRP